MRLKEIKKKLDKFATLADDESTDYMWRLKDIVECLIEYLEEYEAALVRVEALPNKWRKKNILSSSIVNFNYGRECCADELTEALHPEKKEDLG